MPEALKDVFFTQAFHGDLAAAIRQAYPVFGEAAFMSSIYTDDWESLALKERMRRTTEALREGLPDDYRAALDVLYPASAAVEHYGFEKMIFSDYVSLYGMDDWEASLPALEYFTQQMSAEFAVRPFIIQDQPRMMAQRLEWSQHEHPDVRRLSSEGCRPRLPWGISLPALKADPAPILPILENLKTDPSETVRRSVANNLNDIAKDNPQVVIDVLRRWRAIESAEMQRLISHALRTLIKQGDPAALELVGVANGGDFAVTGLAVAPDVVPVGGEVTFSFMVESTGAESQRLMIDYVMHFMRANGRQAPKVFKLAKRDLAPGETLTFSRKHSFRPISTRRYYPGRQAVEIQINGVACGRAEFVLT
jgi:3-methyladenine DNA glycosylase AlkC